MSASAEIVHSLRILGLSSNATASEVRSAFRQLARTYHPDVAGRLYSRKFEQITSAYAVLKDLQHEEAGLSHGKAEASGTARSAKDAHKADVSPNKFRRRISFSGVFGKPLAWYRKRLERIASEKERLRRAAEDAEKKILLEREARIDAALDRGELLIKDFLSRRERETRSVGVHGMALRLMSGVCHVRHLALAYLGELVNEQEIFEALSDSLHKWDIDEKTARLVSMLQLKPEKHRQLARNLAVKAAAIPDALLVYLLQLYNIKELKTEDRELWELYLNHAGAGGAALILRRWPRDSFISESVIRRLMSQGEESVLITLFSIMKQRSLPCPECCSERLNNYLSHTNMAVRVWAKALAAVKN